MYFFDGGSRGNPGPGGSGAIIIQIQTPTAPFRAIWAGSVSYAQQQTTNYAEYQCLGTGLIAARSLGIHSMHVVCDSNLIMRQIRIYRSPKQKKLLKLYVIARRLADQIGVLSWNHHYRKYNKMADHLANQAMDTRSSALNTLPTSNRQLAGWEEWLSNDASQWLSTGPEEEVTLRVSRSLNDR